MNRLLRDLWQDASDAIPVRSVGIAVPEPDDPCTYLHLLAHGEPDNGGHMFSFTPSALITLYVQAHCAIQLLPIEQDRLQRLIADVQVEADALRDTPDGLHASE